eukprot:CAMPEP_0119488584 /NCGR_PEP_ID=MMETSP1344-20130328/14316_1 /TAXON_ID=236787 /ORGANISM="Florenciella parvula, Strain CCMP2471" /LENGTH=56 /DNA_ID=CAMNT_0007523549 /DNA_START=54 /DNA_END=221 /DNA_ORIENTATION=-
MSYGTVPADMSSIEMPRLHVDSSNQARPVKWESPPPAPGLWRSRRRVSMLVIGCVA